MTMNNYLRKISICTLAFALLGAPGLYAQETSQENEPQETSAEELDRRFALSIGLLKGGGSLAGVDFEWMPIDHLGVSVGGGYLGISAGVNYHFEPGIDSSYVGLFWWDQNVGNAALEQMSTGVLVGGRFFKFLSLELGLGYVLRRGPGITANLKALTGTEPPPVMLVYNIGVYFTF